MYVLVCSWVCASVGHAQSQVCGRRRASANIHSARQAGSTSPVAMRQRVRGLHATPYNTPRLKKKSHKPRHRACGMPSLHSHCLNPQLIPPTKPSTPQFPPITHFHNTSSRASTQREYPQSNWIDPTDWQIHFLSFNIYFLHSLYFFLTFVVPLITVKLDSEVFHMRSRSLSMPNRCSVLRGTQS